MATQLAYARSSDTAVHYYDAIRSIAQEALQGEDTDERVARLAFSFGLDVSSVQAEVDESIEMQASA